MAYDSLKVYQNATYIFKEKIISANPDNEITSLKLSPSHLQSIY